LNSLITPIIWRSRKIKALQWLSKILKNMTYLYLVYALFALNVVVGFKIYFQVNSIIKKHELTIKKQSINLQYTAKELAQLIEQTDSEALKQQIHKFIRQTKYNYWLGRIFFLLFIGIVIYLFLID
tara:strand:+ start:56084 stop:56461 length:378 start_codon:yes stop_codon:yes gene_type:complete